MARQGHRSGSSAKGLAKAAALGHSSAVLSAIPAMADSDSFRRVHLLGVPGEYTLACRHARRCAPLRAIAPFPIAKPKENAMLKPYACLACSVPCSPRLMRTIQTWAASPRNGNCSANHKVCVRPSTIQTFRVLSLHQPSETGGVSGSSGLPDPSNFAISCSQVGLSKFAKLPRPTCFVNRPPSFQATALPASGTPAANDPQSAAACGRLFNDLHGSVKQKRRNVGRKPLEKVSPRPLPSQTFDLIDPHIGFPGQQKPSQGQEGFL